MDLQLKLRKSGYGDYFAIDLVNIETGKIVNTTLYANKGESFKIQAFDDDESAWIWTVGKYDGDTITFTDERDGYQWDCEITELTDPVQFRI